MLALYYAIVVSPSVCLSVCPSVGHKLVLYRNDWFLARRLLPTYYFLLSYKEICISSKIRVLPSRTLSQTQDLENFATVSRSRCQQYSSSSSMVELVDDTYTTVDESHGCLLLVGLYFDLLCGSVVQFVSTVDRISTNTSRRAVRLR